ncbi:MAG: amidohydrolase, partial [Verrucomicrobia bacterium]|nr:amidohydrolase [Verrucomicrobiota bacterium]
MNTKTVSSIVALGFSLALGQAADPTQERVANGVAAELPSLVSLYKHFHANPELSFMEAETAKRMAAELRDAGLTVTTGVGGHGLVGVLKNGDGPTLLIRADMDGLPVREETGLPHASKKQMTDDSGNTVHTMHACGHDVHMTSFIGTARLLGQLRDAWSGTLVMIGQPAEERGAGARAMLADGLYERFPVPDYCIGLHVASDQPAGTIGHNSGYVYANVDSVDITVRGQGGHGSQPQASKDPIVLASQIVIALQTIVSREVHPREPAVVTVGSIHGGTKHNIIPNEVKLQLTIRSYTDKVRNQILAAIKRISLGTAQAAGLAREQMPIVTVKDEFTPSAYNDPALAKRVTDAMADWLGRGVLIQRQPTMGGEDFGMYGRTKHKVPIFM